MCQSEGPGNRYVVGLLASTSLDLDHWQAVDYVALRAMLGCPESNSWWLCGTDIRQGPGFLLGDPACDRIVFEPLPFEEVHDTTGIRSESKLVDFRIAYLQRVEEVASRLKGSDTLFLVLCGHGSMRGPLLLGDMDTHVDLWPNDLEHALRGCSATVKLISTACHSGAWKSHRWSLSAAASMVQESIFIGQSASGHFRGAVALLAEHADRYGLQAPKPGKIEYIPRSDGDHIRFREPQLLHDFNTSSRTCQPAPGLPTRKYLLEVHKWLHEFRNDLARTYTDADFTFFPWGADVIWEPLFSPLTNVPHNGCQPPNEGTLASVNSSSDTPISVNSPLDLPSIDGTSMLSEKDEKKLRRLAKDHLDHLPPRTLSENSLCLYCDRLVNSQDPSGGSLGSLTPEEKRATLQVLAERFTYRLLSVIIAKKLNWGDAVLEIGDPFGDQRRLSNDLELQSRAVESGVNLNDLHVPQIDALWSGVAGWMARIWQAAGEPTVKRERWMEVVSEACEEVGVELQKHEK